ncbi:cyclic pyranopterin monophosphate synthase MoaC [Thermogymnomonas acidicola]|uniref:Cyclic pyranopterin monophosphate synthase MoaC n=1 Tax=Thermogymnomonas acidicola TaxID=399579 RepID=A0AA37F8P5_9ARCH|nr:cyclic pyranopterin monophosphate synthase MoaC [Thermogymnomonas acidicola]GGM67365.1 cyclic pyranopterin monophosphate synthase MoaC [Thermogymnomonas acidicola]
MKGGMVDISEKESVLREATAEGRIVLSQRTMEAIRKGQVTKGDVFEATKIAGIQGAKEAWERLPFCHQVPIEGVDVEMEATEGGITVRCSVRAHYRTGVEMDALSCVSSALLNIWDMTKYLEKDETGNYPNTRIEGIRVVRKVKHGAQD